MDKSDKKIKIKLSNGQTEYVTQDQLESLNFQRKLKDQNAASIKTNGPFSRLILLCGFSILATFVILWFSNPGTI